MALTTDWLLCSLASIEGRVVSVMRRMMSVAISYVEVHWRSRE